MDLSNKSRAFMAGYDHGKKNGIFENNNPYNPNTMPLQFCDWEEGFNTGCSVKGWL